MLVNRQSVGKQSNSAVAGGPNRPHRLWYSSRFCPRPLLLPLAVLSKFSVTIGNLGIGFVCGWTASTRQSAFILLHCKGSYQTALILSIICTGRRCELCCAAGRTLNDRLYSYPVIAQSVRSPIGFLPDVCSTACLSDTAILFGAAQRHRARLLLCCGGWVHAV
jgi:hypothetical protein